MKNKKKPTSDVAENVTKNRVADVIIKNEENAELEKDGITVTDIQKLFIFEVIISHVKHKI